MKKREGSHRGNMDLIFVGVLGLALIFAVLISFTINDAVNTALPDSVKNAGPVNPFDVIASSKGLLDQLIVFVVVMSGVASAILASQIRQNPGNWVVGLLVAIILNIIWVPLTNATIMFMSNPIISTVANSFPYTTVLVTNYPTVMFGLFCLISIATYGKPNTPAQSGYYG